MTKSKTTKRALLFSVLALVLCASMLIGSTFAWFTDSVVSGKNKIVAGNLDVELIHTNGHVTDEEVKPDTKLFVNKDGENILWEPGVMVYENFTVKNVGTLALKYKLTVNAWFNSANLLGGESLKDVLKVAFLDHAFDGTRDDVKNLTFKPLTTELTGNLVGGQEASETRAIVIYWEPTDHDNDYNFNNGSKKKTLYAELGVTLVATQDTVEKDSFDESYDAAAEYPIPVSDATELRNALEEGGYIELTKDISPNTPLIEITKNTVIDLNGHKLEARTEVEGANLTITNGTIDAPINVTAALIVEGDSDVTVENCTIKSNSNQAFTVCTNGAYSLDSAIIIKDSTIIAPTVAGKKGYALYAPAGNITFENCDVTGHVFISGGNVTLDGGTYTATGFNNQSKIWNKADTASYVSGSKGGTAFNMGDSILIADRRGGYTLSSVTIRNITFNTEITLKDGTKAVSYGIKYVDMNQNGAADRANLVIENNTFNNKINDADPEMYIDLTGADITNP